MMVKRQILVVDDEPDLVRMVTLRLEAAGYEVLVAMDGEEALTKARAEKPDLILLDLMLPKLSGYEVCKRLKEDSRFQQIPILLFTARKSGTEEKQMPECGADGAIYKPYDPQELLETIRSQLSKSPDSKTPPSN